MDEHTSPYTSRSIRSKDVDAQCIEDCENSLKSHEVLCEITEKSLEKILKNDALMNDIPYDITLEEVLAQIAVVRGQSITVYIKRGDYPKLKIVIPESSTTVANLKKAIKRHYELNERRVAVRKLKKQRHTTTAGCSNVQLYSSTSLESSFSPSTSSVDTIKISWRYIWRTYFLEYDNNVNGKTLLSDDNRLLSEYGVRNKSVLRFVKKTKRNNCRK